MMASVEVVRVATRAEAQQQALVLAAAGIECSLWSDSGTIAVLVAPGEAGRAHRELEAYRRERFRAHEPVPRVAIPEGALETALVYVAVLLFFYVAQHRDLASIDWVERGAVAAGAIAGGQWWRTITALTLHADLPHIAGNLLFGLLFCVPLMARLGVGLSWLAMLLSGAVGNAIDALMHRPEHTAIGASTALFGALGVLASQAGAAAAESWQGAIRRWAPYGAGLMLLVFLGFGGERTDIAAHVAGFGVGSGIGLALRTAGPRLWRGEVAQWAYGLAALMLPVIAWALALRANG